MMIMLIVGTTFLVTIAVMIGLAWWLGWLGGVGVALGILAVVVGLYVWVIKPWHIRRSRLPGPVTDVVGAGRSPWSWPRASRGAGAVFGLDLVLLHAPSVYDFRDQVILQGPVADVVPSTDEFEMYPIGLTSIASYLESNAYNVRIVNLAYRMLRSSSFDAVRHLRRLRAPVFGIDLHWMPHAQGALAVAKLVKQVHPDSLVLMGGLSATYYNKELVRLPMVDFVLRGDSTEEPARQLLHALREGRTLETVENLTWKRSDGEVVVNPLSSVPDNLDYIDVPDYRYMLRSVFKYRHLADVVPYLEWLQHPATMVLNARGCTYDCATCGGSRSAYRSVCNRSRPAFRSPEKLVADIRTITSFSADPIFMVHDPRIGGLPRAERFFELLGAAQIGNELVLELFFPAGDDFFSMVERTTSAWSLQITIESPDEHLRRVNGKFSCSNKEVEASIAAALAHGCRKLDLFFMVGIPHQTQTQALATVDYCAYLVERFGADPRLQFYVAPLGPFLDPGSRAFEEPELGYHHRFDTLEEHSAALLQPSWKDILSYETDTMTREQIVESSYAVANGLNELKHRACLIDDATHATVHGHLHLAREALAMIEEAKELPANETARVLGEVRDQVATANTATLCGGDELRWKPTTGLRITKSLLRGLALGLGVEILRAMARFRGRYDSAVTTNTGSSSANRAQDDHGCPAVALNTEKGPIQAPAESTQHGRPDLLTKGFARTTTSSGQ
jgi:B12-binding domain/radical SAM domain protein